MRPTSHSCAPALTRLALALCLTATAASMAGCSRLRPFHHHNHGPGHDEPVFGTAPISEVGRARMEAGTERDLYAESVRRPARPSANGGRTTRELAEAPADKESDQSTASGSDAIAPPIPVTIDEPLVLPRVIGPEPGEPIPSLAAAAIAPSIKQIIPPRQVGPILAEVIASARRQVDGLSTYRVNMQYQERAGAGLQPADTATLSIQSRPKRVRIEWADGPNSGREVIWASDLHQGLMHVRMGGMMKALPRISMRPDSPMATRSSRHPINEAGFDTIVTRMEEGLAEANSSRPVGTRIQYLGLELGDGLDRPCHKIERITPTGETWLVYLNPESYLPTCVRATGPRGELLENYVFGPPELNPEDLAQATAFDPDLRWGPGGNGLLQRLARSAGGDPKASAPQ